MRDTQGIPIPVKTRKRGRVLVTDGRQRATLAVVRSLGRLGHEVIVVEDVIPSLASTSRYSTRGLESPSPHSDPLGYVDFIHDEVRRNRYGLLIPMTDVTAILVARHAARLREHVRVPLVAWECFEKALDKEHVLRLAQQLGVPVPRTWTLESPADVDRHAPEFEYPVVIKPRRSKHLGPDGWISGSVSYAYSMDEVRRTLVENGSPMPMIQERVPGPGCGGFFLFAHGEMKAAFFHKRLREKPPSGGVSVLRESIAVHPQMRDYAVTLLSALGWHGVAMVEFKLDSRDGLPKLMEINPRFWGSLQLAIDSGVDFPALLYEMEVEGDVEAVRSYAVGVRSRWFLGDLDHLLIRIGKSRRELNLPADYPGRWKTLIDFLNLWRKNTRYEVCRREDMSPFWFELREYVKHLFRRRKARHK